MAEQVPVQFAGKGSGVAELTWGQREIWLLMQAQQSSLSIGGTHPLPAGLTVPELVAELAYLMGRHQSLRTRLRFTGDGRPQQVLADSGAVPLALVDAGDADPAETASALCGRFVEKNFDYSGEWPVRWAVVLTGGKLRQLVWVVCHLAADGHGVAVMMADLEARRTGAQPAAAGTQPLEQARAQAKPGAGAASLRHWRRLLRAVPARRYAGSADHRRPRYWQGCYISPASHLAVQAIALRTRATTSTVLMAAFAVQMARLTGIQPSVLQVVVSNRFRSGLGACVSPVMQTGLCVIDVADATFDEVVTRTFRGAMAAYKFAYYDPLAREALIESVSAERGETVDVSCSINDRRIASRQEPAGPPAPAAQIRAALARSELSWGFRRDRPTGRCFLLIDDVPDTVFYELVADTHFVAPADMEACLRGMEAVVVAAAIEPAAASVAALDLAGTPAGAGRPRLRRSA